MKRGEAGTEDEDQTGALLQGVSRIRWSLIAVEIKGWTDNGVKNKVYWTFMRKRDAGFNEAWLGSVGYLRGKVL